MIDFTKYPKEAESAFRAFPCLRDAVEMSPLGNGHINVTYSVKGADGKRYVLQKVNGQVFPHPEQVMQNALAVTSFLEREIKAAGGNPDRETLHYKPCGDGGMWYASEEGNLWRVSLQITDSVTYENAETDLLFELSGEAFGYFQRMLSRFPAHTLHEVIPKFHHTPSRYQAFLRAEGEDKMGRAQKVQKEIAFYHANEAFYFVLENAHEAGTLPLKVTHNDTKLNNILFDRATDRPLCVIDLDTVMPGYAVNDFGDSIRFGASTAAEDEPDLQKVHFSVEKFTAYARGFLRGAGDGLSQAEIDLLPEGAIMMTLECGMRFLTDYLQGDTYFRIARPDHNLDRCRTQIALADEMLKALPTLHGIIHELQTEK